MIKVNLNADFWEGKMELEIMGIDIEAVDITTDNPQPYIVHTDANGYTTHWTMDQLNNLVHPSVLWQYEHNNTPFYTMTFGESDDTNEVNERVPF